MAPKRKATGTDPNPNPPRRTRASTAADAAAAAAAAAANPVVPAPPRRGRGRPRGSRNRAGRGGRGGGTAGAGPSNRPAADAPAPNAMIAAAPADAAAAAGNDAAAGLDAGFAALVQFNAGGAANQISTNAATADNPGDVGPGAMGPPPPRPTAFPPKYLKTKSKQHGVARLKKALDESDEDFAVRQALRNKQTEKQRHKRDRDNAKGVEKGSPQRRIIARRNLQNSAETQELWRENLARLQGSITSTMRERDTELGNCRFCARGTTHRGICEGGDHCTRCEAQGRECDRMPKKHLVMLWGTRHRRCRGCKDKGITCVIAGRRQKERPVAGTSRCVGCVADNMSCELETLKAVRCTKCGWEHKCVACAKEWRRCDGRIPCAICTRKGIACVGIRPDGACPVVPMGSYGLSAENPAPVEGSMAPVRLPWEIEAAAELAAARRAAAAGGAEDEGEDAGEDDCEYEDEDEEEVEDGVEDEDEVEYRDEDEGDYDYDDDGMRVEDTGAGDDGGCALEEWVRAGNYEMVVVPPCSRCACDPSRQCDALGPCLECTRRGISELDCRSILPCGPCYNAGQTCDLDRPCTRCRHAGFSAEECRPVNYAEFNNGPPREEIIWNPLPDELTQDQLARLLPGPDFRCGRCAAEGIEGCSALETPCAGCRAVGRSWDLCRSGNTCKRCLDYNMACNGSGPCAPCRSVENSPCAAERARFGPQEPTAMDFEYENARNSDEMLASEDRDEGATFDPHSESFPAAGELEFNMDPRLVDPNLLPMVLRPAANTLTNPIDFTVRSPIPAQPGYFPASNTMDPSLIMGQPGVNARNPIPIASSSPAGLPQEPADTSAFNFQPTFGGFPNHLTPVHPATPPLPQQPQPQSQPLTPPTIPGPRPPTPSNVRIPLFPSFKLREGIDLDQDGHFSPIAVDPSWNPPDEYPCQEPAGLGGTLCRRTPTMQCDGTDQHAAPGHSVCTGCRDGAERKTRVKMEAIAFWKKLYPCRGCAETALLKIADNALVYHPAGGCACNAVIGGWLCFGCRDAVVDEVKARIEDTWNQLTDPVGGGSRCPECYTKPAMAREVAETVYQGIAKCASCFSWLVSTWLY